MCGIVGYLGSKKAAPILLEGLARLEYRGYDSAGIAVVKDSAVQVMKKQGKVADLAAIVPDDEPSTVGIGHTRWATHGVPSDVNAHPHQAPSGKFALVHNGIIENYAAIKSRLEQDGFVFKSETDTEVLACLIDDILAHTNGGLLEAMRLALREVVGAYAIVVVEAAHPDRLLVAKMGSPLVIGVAEDNSFVIASDATPVVGHTRQVIYLDDGKVAQLQTGKKPLISDIKTANSEDPFIEKLDLDIESIEKDGYEHFMLKEINEQPRSVGDTMRGRILIQQNSVRLGGLADFEPQLTRAKRILIVACGTSWHAGLVGEYLIEQLAGVPVEVEYASEFRYRQPIINSDDIVIAISQSGETADTLAAIELAKSRGALTLGICNVVGSSIARLTDAGVYTHAGPEMSVASTKAFTSQVTVLSELALRLAILRSNINNANLRTLIGELSYMPETIAAILKTEPHIKQMAEAIAKMDDVLFIGRGVSFPVALEGALKLKEISYIHAEGYPAGELKHGPIALIDEQTPTIAIMPNDSHKEKMVSNIQEIKARKGNVWVITSDADYASQYGQGAVLVPHVHELLSPLVCSIPLQLLAYHVALLRGNDVDKPRNLAKSVTVE